MGRLPVVIVAGCLAVLGLAGCRAAADAGTGTAFVAGDGSIVLLAPQDRVAAPDLSGPTLDGGTFSLADHRGEVVVLNVWASWCAPCRAEAPTLESLWTDVQGDGVQFVGLDTRDTAAAATAFVENYGITYPNVVDTDGRLQLLFGDSLPPQAIPSTVVIDRDGRVAGRILGRASESSLRGLIEPLLAEGSPSPS
ncbi:MAG: TlpA family protein disulfide reductase [Candidatus Nanopelagicales bacterium]